MRSNSNILKEVDEKKSYSANKDTTQKVIPPSKTLVSQPVLMKN